GRIFVDYLRNGLGATAVAAYSTRARPGAAVSTPLSWDELSPGISANHFTLENLPKRLAFLDRDPWEGFLSLRQKLPGLSKAVSKPERISKILRAPRISDGSLAQLPPEAAVPPKDAFVKYWKMVAKDALKYLGRRPLKLFHHGPVPVVPDAVRRLHVRDGESE